MKKNQTPEEIKEHLRLAKEHINTWRTVFRGKAELLNDQPKGLSDYIWFFQKLRKHALYKEGIVAVSNLIDKSNEELKDIHEKLGIFNSICDVCRVGLLDAYTLCSILGEPKSDPSEDYITNDEDTETPENEIPCITTSEVKDTPLSLYDALSKLSAVVRIIRDVDKRRMKALLTIHELYPNIYNQSIALPTPSVISLEKYLGDTTRADTENYMGETVEKMQTLTASVLLEVREWPADFVTMITVQTDRILGIMQYVNTNFKTASVSPHADDVQSYPTHDGDMYQCSEDDDDDEETDDDNENIEDKRPPLKQPESIILMEREILLNNRVCALKEALLKIADNARADESDIEPDMGEMDAFAEDPSQYISEFSVETQSDAEKMSARINSMAEESRQKKQVYSEMERLAEEMDI